MHRIDVDRLLSQSHWDSPALAEMNYDLELCEFEQIVGNKADIDWRWVRRTAVALLERKLDLAVAAVFARAAYRVDGAMGLVDGLALVGEILAGEGSAEWIVRALAPLHSHEGLVNDLHCVSAEGPAARRHIAEALSLTIAMRARLRERVPAVDGSLLERLEKALAGWLGRHSAAAPSISGAAPAEQPRAQEWLERTARWSAQPEHASLFVAAERRRRGRRMVDRLREVTSDAAIRGH